MNYDEATLAQVEMIQKEVSLLLLIYMLFPYSYYGSICFQIQETSEYVSDKADLLSLANEYPEDDTIYQAKIKVVLLNA